MGYRLIFIPKQKYWARIWKIRIPQYVQIDTLTLSVLVALTATALLVP